VKRVLLILTFALSCWVNLSAQLPESVRKALDEKLDEYTQAIETQPFDTQCKETDFIIGTCQDSLVRQYVAIKLYTHFMESKLMGSENIVVHIFDKWFSDGTVKMRSEADDLAARMFAQINRPSLIGKTAPLLCLESSDGKMLETPNRTSRRFSVLFFYNIDCPKCRIEVIMLRNILENSDYPIDVYAIYAGKDEEGWRRYYQDELDPDCRSTRVFNLWNPSSDNSLVEQYGLLQTPKMFLINPESMIIGRSLDCLALSQMLQNLFSRRELGYGEDASHQFFDSVFSEVKQPQEIISIADTIAVRSLEAGDTTLFRQLTGDMLYYLSSNRKEPYVSGCSYVIDKYILERDDIWNSPDDSLKVVGLAQMLKQLYAKSPVGSKIPDLRIYGTLKGHGGSSSSGFRWTRELKSKSTLIIFHTSDCPVCREQIKVAEESINNVPKRKVFEVDVEQALRNMNQEEANRMMSSFDLSGLPFILEINRKGVILGKYLSL